MTNAYNLQWGCHILSLSHTHTFQTPTFGVVIVAATEAMAEFMRYGKDGSFHGNCGAMVDESYYGGVEAELRFLIW